jgi:hypothetical protein
MLTVNGKEELLVRDAKSCQPLIDRLHHRETIASVQECMASILELAPMHADKWRTRLLEAIFILDELPARCPVIPEAAELGYPARHLLCGNGHGFIESSSISAKRSSMYVCCGSGMLPAMPLPSMMWNRNRRMVYRFKPSFERQLERYIL